MVIFFSFDFLENCNFLLKWTGHMVTHDKCRWCTNAVFSLRYCNIRLYRYIWKASKPLKQLSNKSSGVFITSILIAILRFCAILLVMEMQLLSHCLLFTFNADLNLNVVQTCWKWKMFFVLIKECLVKNRAGSTPSILFYFFIVWTDPWKRDAWLKVQGKA